MDKTTIFIELLIPVIVVALALIPAFIAKSKNRSFGWFFFFGIIFGFIPATIVATCIGDRFDDEKVSGKGLYLVVLFGVTALLLKPSFSMVDKLSIILAEKLNIQYDINNPSTWVVAVFAFVITLGVPFFIGLLVATYLKPYFISFALKANRKKEKETVYAGINYDVVNRLNDAIPIAAKYDPFFRKRDIIASYRKLSFGRVLAICIPPVIFICLLFIFFWFRYMPQVNREIYDTGSFWHYLGITAAISAGIMLILSKPVAMIRYGISLKYDEKDAREGYTARIREHIPELKDTDLRYKKLKTIRTLMKFGVTNDIRMACYYADQIAKGVKMAKIVASVAIPAAVCAVAGAAAWKYANDYAKDAYEPKSTGGYWGHTAPASKSDDYEADIAEADAKRQKEYEDECIRTNKAWEDAQEAHRNGYVDENYVRQCYQDRCDAAGRAGWSPDWY